MNERQLSLQDVGHEWAGMVEAAALQHCSTARGCRRETGVRIRDWDHTYCALGLGWVGWAAPHLVGFYSFYSGIHWIPHLRGISRLLFIVVRNGSELVRQVAK